MMKRLLAILMLTIMVAQSGIMTFTITTNEAWDLTALFSDTEDIGSSTGGTVPAEEDAHDSEVPEPWEEDTCNQHASYCLHRSSSGSERLPHPASASLEGAPDYLLKPPTAAICPV